MASHLATVLLVSIFALGASLLTYGLVALAQFLRFRLGAESDPGSLADGLVAVAGTATRLEDGGTVTSPLTGRPALWYEYAVERHGGVVNRPDWTEVATGTESRPFALETDAGPVGVDPRGATVDVTPADELDVVANPDALDDLRAVLETVADDDAGETVAADDAVETVDVGVATLDAGERYRLVERRVEAGDALAVTGSAVVDDGDGPAAATDPVTLRAAQSRGWLGRLFGVPFVVGRPDGDGAAERLRDRALVGLVVGLPVTMLSVVYAFPP